MTYVQPDCADSEDEAAGEPILTVLPPVEGPDTDSGIDSDDEDAPAGEIQHPVSMLGVCEFKQQGQQSHIWYSSVS